MKGQPNDFGAAVPSDHARARGGRADNGDVMVWVPALMVDDLKRATDEMPCLLSNAASVFKFLFKLTASGFAPEEGELCAIYDLCGRALTVAADNEGDTLARFDMLLRDLLKPNEPEGATE